MSLLRSCCTTPNSLLAESSDEGGEEELPFRREEVNDMNNLDEANNDGLGRAFSDGSSSEDGDLSHSSWQQNVIAKSEAISNDNNSLSNNSSNSNNKRKRSKARNDNDNSVTKKTNNHATSTWLSIWMSWWNSMSLNCSSYKKRRLSSTTTTSTTMMDRNNSNSSNSIAELSEESFSYQSSSGGGSHDSNDDKNVVSFLKSAPRKKRSYNDFSNNIKDTATILHSNDKNLIIQILPQDVLITCLSYTSHDPRNVYSIACTCQLFRSLITTSPLLLRHVQVMGTNVGTRSTTSSTSSSSELKVLLSPSVAAVSSSHSHLQEEAEEENSIMMEQQGQGQFQQQLMYQQRPLFDLHLSCSSKNGHFGYFLNGQVDTREDAILKLQKYVNADNVQAIYMMAIIQCYCYDDMETSISLLRRAIKISNHLPCYYALGIMLRDVDKVESMRVLQEAVQFGYLPAIQEICSGHEIKLLYQAAAAAGAAAGAGQLSGEEPRANELRKYMDPIGLTLLLKRYYMYPTTTSTTINNIAATAPAGATSHCWNPFCGKWAYRVTRTAVDVTTTTTTTANISNHASEGASAGERKAARMKMCSCCRRAKYCSKLCQVYDWRSGRHKEECQFL